MKVLIENIIHQLEEVQNGKLWIGSNFTRKLNQIDEQTVFTRPIKDLHSVAEIISHLTLWRKETILKIKTGKGSKTDDCEENWLTNEKLRVKGWNSIKTEYDRTLSELIDLLKMRLFSQTAMWHQFERLKPSLHYRHLDTVLRIKKVKATVRVNAGFDMYIGF